MEMIYALFNIFIIIYAFYAVTLFLVFDHNTFFCFKSVGGYYIPKVVVRTIFSIISILADIYMGKDATLIPSVVSVMILLVTLIAFYADRNSDMYLG